MDWTEFNFHDYIIKCVKIFSILNITYYSDIQTLARNIWKDFASSASGSFILCVPNKIDVIASLARQALKCVPKSDNNAHWLQLWVEHTYPVAV